MYLGASAVPTGSSYYTTLGIPNTYSNVESVSVSDSRCVLTSYEDSYMEDVRRIARDVARNVIRDFIESVSDEKLEVDNDAFKNYVREFMSTQDN